MSVKNVKLFFEKAAKDKALKAKLKLLAAKEKALYEKLIADLVRIASKEGFDFTVKDYIKATSQKPKGIVPPKREGGLCAAGSQILHTCPTQGNPGNNPPQCPAGSAK